MKIAIRKNIHNMSKIYAGKSKKKLSRIEKKVLGSYESLKGLEG